MTSSLSIPQNPRIAIIGAGAIGMYYGGRLAQHGHDVHFLLRSGYEQARQHGIVVESWQGNFRIAPDSLQLYVKSSEMPQADLVIVTLKTTGNPLLAELLPPLLHEQTAIITMQNGIGVEEDLAAMFGAKRMLGAMAFICCNRDDGVVKHIAEGFIRLGEFDRPPSERTHAIARLFTESKVNCTVLDDLRRGRWEKLVWNIPFNGLGALLNLTTDRLLADEKTRARVVGLMREVISIARANGVEIPESFLDRMIQITLPIGPYKTSMQIDREAGRAMEIEPIIGRPLKVGRGHGMALPLLEELYRGLCEIRT
jgi:2-dehydropantoate 2-reductase